MGCWYTGISHFIEHYLTGPLDNDCIVYRLKVCGNPTFFSINILTFAFLATVFLN